MSEPDPNARPPRTDADYRDALRAALERHAGRPVRCVETHVSWVLLDGVHAWKLKKPVKLDFLDFGPLEVRERVCRAELRLNRRLAPELYLDVVPIFGSSEAPSFGQAMDTPVIDWAVRMQQFPADALLDTRLAAGTLAATDIDQLADRIASFHEGADVAPAGYGTADRIAEETAKVLDTLARLAEAAPPHTPRSKERSADVRAALARLRPWCEARANALAPAFQARLAAGRVRDCHGDLHLANAVALAGGVTAFDCLEFAPALRMTDVCADVAFLAMDLIAHDQPGLAMRFIDRWLERSGDHDALTVLRYYLVYRSLVRAMVAAIRAAQRSGAPDAPDPPAEARPDYLALALRLIEPGPPALAITHGLSGSGKSRHAARFVERHGAIRLRSDVIRKQLFGLPANARSGDRVPGGIYDPAATARTYERLLSLAGVALDDGWPVIVDATFLRVAQRRPFRELATARGLPFMIIDCQAPLALLRQRIDARTRQGTDPSEADVAVLERQREQDEAFDTGELPFVRTASEIGP